MNAASFRSHAIFILKLRTTNVDSQESKVSQLHIIDLAGSEEIQNWEVKDKRLKQTINIKKSLLTIGKVIYALNTK